MKAIWSLDFKVKTVLWIIMFVRFIEELRTPPAVLLYELF